MRRTSFRTRDGLEVKPVYTHTDLQTADPARELGTPGAFPYTRGVAAEGYRDEVWREEQYCGFNSPADSNERHKRILADGSNGGVFIALDLPTQVGYDSDDPLVRGQVGRVGTPISCLADLRELLDGIDLVEAKFFFTTGNCLSPVILSMFIAIAQERGVSVHDLRVGLQNEPLKEYIARGTYITPVEPALELAVDVIEYCTNEIPEWTPITVAGTHIRGAGATPGQELAFTLANALTYVDRCVARGLDPNVCTRRFKFQFAVEMNFFEEICKFRAARRLWAELLASEYGVTDPDALAIETIASVSGVNMTAAQPMNNIVRLTLEVLAGVLGGTQVTRTKRWDEALALPTSDSVKLAMRTSSIIQEETDITWTTDPLGGSYFIESLTSKLVEEARAEVQRIRAMGGGVAAIHNGHYLRAITQGAQQSQQELDQGKRVIIGINSFREPPSGKENIFKMPPSAEAKLRERLKVMKAARDPAKVQALLDDVRRALIAKENTVPATLAAVKADVTLGEIAALYREVHGEMKEDIAI